MVKKQLIQDGEGDWIKYETIVIDPEIIVSELMVRKVVSNVAYDTRKRVGSIPVRVGPVTSAS